MNTAQIVERDERTEAVEYAGYKWGFTFFTFALYADVFYRAVLRREAAWELLGLVVVGSGIRLVYQVWHKAMGREGAMAAIIGVFIAVLTASAVAALGLHFLH
jgi:hypothetical protein